MKKSNSILLILCLATLSAFALSEENLHETRDAKPGGKLVVDVDFGSITVSAGAGDKVVIDAHREIKASSKEKEEEYLAAAPMKVTVEGDNVVVRAVRKHESLGAQLWNLMGNISTDGRYTIRVPANFNADLQTAGGDVSANGLTGTIKVETSGGDLDFDRLHGSLHAETSGGDVKVNACEGSTSVETSGGRIQSTGGSGDLRAETSGGNVTVVDFAGDARVETSGGKLTLANISGKLNGETSGGAIAALLPSSVTSDVRLETSAGAIQVVAPANAALTIDAETSAGSVRTDLPIKRTHEDDDSLKGTINGGGKALVLRSGAGSIDIAADKETVRQ